MTGGSRSRGTVFPMDTSRYPEHIPTLREQLHGSKWDPELPLTRKQVENMTALGVLCNPLTSRAWLEEHYEPGTTPSRRTRGASVGLADGDGDDPVGAGGEGRVTVAFMRGPDHPDTRFPSGSRL